MVHVLGVGRDLIGKNETLLWEDGPPDVLRFQDVVRNRQVDWSSRSCCRDLEGPPKHGGKSGRVMALPGDLGELAVDFLLVEPGSGTQKDVVVTPFVVQKPSGDHDGRTVSAGIVHLPR